MLQFKNAQKGALIYIAGGLFIAALAGVGLLSYQFGYSRGSGTLTQPPLSANLIHIGSTGDLSVALDDPGTKVDFGNFWKTWNILDKNFNPTSASSSATSTSETRILGAIDGLVRSYNDPYTVFFPKANATAFKEQVNGEFEGIGAGLNTSNGATVVVGTLPDSPAAKAGIVAGDRIVAVDGIPTADSDLNTIISHIRGAKGTVVSLSVVHPKSQKEVTIAVTRGTVVIPTTATRVVAATKNVIAAAVAKAATSATAVAGSVKEVLGIEKQKEAQAAKQQFFVLQLATFAKSSTDAFIKDLQRFAKSDTPYLIIDLRNNPGGYLDVAVDLASYFLPKGAMVVSEKTGANSVTSEHRSLGYGALDGIASSSRRIVVLVNRNSASASEILAGALQDHDIAKVVGETSYGKGSVQTLVDIGTLGSLKITIARWYTPSGKNISHTGIAPDVVVDLKDPKFASSTDPYIDAATEALLDDSLWK